MKQKFEKYLKYVAAAIFVATLAINIAITMDDPFVLMSNDAVATTNTGEEYTKIPQTWRRISQETVQSWSGDVTINGLIPFKNQVVNMLTAIISEPPGASITWDTNKTVHQYKQDCIGATDPQLYECITIDWTTCEVSVCPQQGIGWPMISSSN